jgi:hypothetical protein
LDVLIRGRSGPCSRSALHLACRGNSRREIPDTLTEWWSAEEAEQPSPFAGADVEPDALRYLETL